MKYICCPARAKCNQINPYPVKVPLDVESKEALLECIAPGYHYSGSVVVCIAYTKSEGAFNCPVRAATQRARPACGRCRAGTPFEVAIKTVLDLQRAIIVKERRKGGGQI